MESFVWALAGAFLIGGYWFYNRYQSKKKKREQLAESWGKRKTRDYNWSLMRYYHDLIKDPSATPVMDDDTWSDLNFDTLFGHIDRTESTIGQQVLFDMLRKPGYDIETLSKRRELIHLFQKQSDLRIDLQVELQKLNGTRFGKLPHIIFGELPEVPAWFKSFLAIPFLVVLSVFLGFIHPIFWVGLVGFPIVNMVIQYMLGERIARYTASISALRPLLSSAEKISQVNSRHNHPLAAVGTELEEQCKQVKKLKKRVNNFLYEGNPDNLATFIWEYLEMLFLLKINMFTLSVKEIERNQKALQKIFQKVGYIDALIAASSFKSGFEKTCRPTFTTDSESLHYEQMYHPLLKNPVPNTITVDHKGILITGSNMSGKTTFLRTMGVNQVLAQTFYFCCAEDAEIKFCHVISSMRREDDITEGKSFYLGEVERVKTLIESAHNNPKTNLFLLDEIFRGTNTIERISASLEVLKWLNSESDFVLASTHDLELVDLLDEEYTFYHFSEKVGDQELRFDYRIKPGYSSTKNAIKLLKVWQYPEEIVAGALKVSQQLEKQGVVDVTQTESFDS